MLRLKRAASLAHAGDHAKAAVEAEAQAAGEKVPADTLYNCACVFALCSAESKDDADLKKQYADRAMAGLLKAVKAGYKDAAHLTKDIDLDPLRGREDFKMLIAELEAKAEPKK